LLAAWLSKTVHRTTFPLWSESSNFTICSLSSQVKSGPQNAPANAKL
jgi:hypothetical protein